MSESGAINPTAHEVAATIVAAARAHGENPTDVANGLFGSRAKWLAFSVLIDAFPTVYFRTIATWCGFDRESGGNARAALAHNLRQSKWKWWRQADVDVVRAELAAAIALTDASLAEKRALDVGVLAPKTPATPSPDTEAYEDLAPVAVIPPEVADISRAASVERRKAWQSGAPIEPPVIVESEPAKPAPPKVSAAAQALASFQRARPERKAAKPEPEVRRATFTNPGLVDFHYRPDRPARDRGVAVVTAGLMGDPAPGRSALAQRQAEEAALANPNR